MTLSYLFGLAVGTLAGVLGTLTALAIRRRPRRLEYDATLERLRSLDRVAVRHGSNMLPDLHLGPYDDAPSAMPNLGTHE